MFYDEEAIYQDADIEQAQWGEQGRAVDAAQAAGRCCHLSAVGVSASGEIFYPEQEGLVRGQLRCTEGCGATFESDEDWDAAKEEAIWG